MEHHDVVQALAGWVSALARNAVTLWLGATCAAFLTLVACRLVAGRARMARRVRRRLLFARRRSRRRKEMQSGRRSSKNLLRLQGPVSGTCAR